MVALAWPAPRPPSDVVVEMDRGRVSVRLFAERDGEMSSLRGMLTPKQARRIAARLIVAADAVEKNPMNGVQFRRGLVLVGIKAGLDLGAAVAAAKEADAWCAAGGSEHVLTGRAMPEVLALPPIAVVEDPPRRPEGTKPGRARKRNGRRLETAPAAARQPRKESPAGAAASLPRRGGRARRAELLLRVLADAGAAGLSIAAIIDAGVGGKMTVTKLLKAARAAGDVERSGPRRGQGVRWLLRHRGVRQMASGGARVNRVAGNGGGAAASSSAARRGPRNGGGARFDAAEYRARILRALEGTGARGLARSALKTAAGCSQAAITKGLAAAIADGAIERLGGQRGRGVAYRLKTHSVPTRESKAARSSPAAGVPARNSRTRSGPESGSENVGGTDTPANPLVKAAGGSIPPAANSAPPSAQAPLGVSPKAAATPAAAAWPWRRVEAALLAAGGAGMSKGAIATRTGLEGTALDDGITHCVRKGLAVERDRVFFARGHAARGEAAP